jgi:thiol:disulfide interchange protein
MKRLLQPSSGRKLMWLATVALLALSAQGRPVGAGQEDPFSLKYKAGEAPAKVEKLPPPNGEQKPANAQETKPAAKGRNASRVEALINFKVSVTPATARRGEIVKLTITGSPKPGYHTYALTKHTENQFAVAIDYKKSPSLKPLFPVEETPPALVDEPGGGQTYQHKSSFTWSQDLWVLPDAKPGTATLHFDVKTQVCDEHNCTPGTIPLEATVNITAEPAVALAPRDVQALQARSQQTAGTAPGSSGSGLLAFILAGVFWGFVSLITPCVFPMIPITVSFFLKQSEKEHHRPLTMAVVYCVTIIVVLTIAAVALLSFFRALSTSPTMNFVIGGLFIFFALSLFGMYDIELPSGLARFTSAREGKGGLLGTMFMALTFTIISFACVAPFLGGFGGTAANSNLTFTHRLLGGLAFAATFASPFFILALFPTLLKKMPKSGSWLNSVKVVMGFLELAAALKFLRAGELVTLPEPEFLTYDFVLGLYIALSLLCGLYLLGVYRLPHDTPGESLSVPRLLFSLAFLGLAFYLTPALFKYGDKGKSQRPTGTVFAWLDSFLLPDEAESDLPWIGSLADGLKKARAERKFVFVDFTGKTCTNCKLNEQNVFTQATVKDLLKRYTLVQLYTDVVPRWLYPPAARAQLGSGAGKQREDAQANLRFQREKFDTEQLPLYLILEPLADGKYREVARYDEGKINSDAAFIQFLEGPLEKLQASAFQPGAAETSRQPASTSIVTPPPLQARSARPGPPAAHDTELPWIADLDKGLKLARAAKGLVFVDFTGEGCPNCKANERTVFTLASVKDALRHYSLVQLYTDKVPQKYYRPEQRADAGNEPNRATTDALANYKFQESRFKTVELPLYVILEPQADGRFREVSRYDEGRISDPEAFLRFLRAPLVERGILPRVQARLEGAP